ncbi:MAG TPA: Na+/H+ antiporter NhaC [Dehalococcoidia bacterium]|nr:Na+/H+ antiporter NhaC [Dehalococcoidia bacterium]
MSIEGEAAEIRPPSLLDAVIPVVVLIILIATSVALFGIDATEGPLQVALLTSAATAALVARKNGHEYIHISEAVVGGISSAMGAIFILLAVGALIGTWNMSGTTPTVVYYGIKLLDPEFFYVAAAAICAAVGLVTGSSWTTAGTLGVAFVGMAPVLEVSPEITAGAVISGSYFGDKMTPLSETTILVPQLVGGLTVYEHIRALLWTTGPAIAIALVIFLVLGLQEDVTATSDQKDAATAAIDSVYNISFINLLPLVLLIVCAFRKYPPFMSVFAAALLAGVMGAFTQPDLVQDFADDPDLGAFLASIKAIYAAMGTGFVLETGIEPLDQLFSRGGMSSMLTTIWLVLGALAFASVMEHAGFLGRLFEGVMRLARSTGALIATVAATSIGLNVIACDQYVAIVMPARTFRLEFQKRQIAPQVLSRTVEDTGTVTSALVPWNTCGAYMTGTLGVSTFDYFPYAFFNLLNPVISVLYGLTGFQVKKIPPEEGTPEPFVGVEPSTEGAMQ